MGFWGVGFVGVFLHLVGTTISGRCQQFNPLKSACLTLGTVSCKVDTSLPFKKLVPEKRGRSQQKQEPRAAAGQAAGRAGRTDQQGGRGRSQLPAASTAQADRAGTHLQAGRALPEGWGLKGNTWFIPPTWLGWEPTRGHDWSCLIPHFVFLGFELLTV